MSLREILLPLRGDGKGEVVLDHAIALAQRFNAHIDVVHCRPRPEAMISLEMRLPKSMREQLLQSASGVADEDERYLRGLFNQYCQKHALEICEDRPWPKDKTSARWREETGTMPDVVGKIGRVYDMTILARPDAKKNLGFRTLKAAMLQAGRPALLCPPEKTIDTIASNPAIAWNGSTETARTIDVAMPLLYACGKATIISVDTGTPLPGPDAHALADHLREHGFEIGVEIIKAENRQVPERILGAAKTARADCLITGAFGHSRKLEFIMGSVTQHLIERSDLPLLMMH